MARITPVHRPADFVGDPAEVAPLFDALFSGAATPAFDADHDGLAIAAHTPRLALALAQVSRIAALDLAWCGRADLRELAILTVNLHYRSSYGRRSRVAALHAAGIDDAMIAAVPDWRTSHLFDPAQRLVIEYGQAVPTGAVPDELFDRVVAAFGERGAVECTAVIGLWSFWAMFLNATRSDDHNIGPQ
jgi:4-carboxymuconolactone decarboxylase